MHLRDCAVQVTLFYPKTEANELIDKLPQKTSREKEKRTEKELID